jgi:hypothetical protein
LFARDFPEIVEEIRKSAGFEDGSRQVGTCGEKSLQALAPHAVARGQERIQQEKKIGLRSSLRAAAGQILDLALALDGREREKQNGRTDSTIRAEAQLRTGADGLGMSYEVTDVRLADTRARVWMLEKVMFTGAAILRRNKAAYQDTWIELE